MANVIFEEGTQTQASAFQAGDTLLFKTTAPTDVDVVYNAASGFQVATTTLTVGEQSLTFAADALSDVTTVLTFFGAAGELQIGGTAPDTLTLNNADDSAVWGLGGVDSITVNGAGAHIVHGGDGADTITLASGATATGDYTIFGDAGADTVAQNVVAATGNLVISGGLGADVLAGGDGNDHIYGFQVAPSGTTADGNDTITAGLGNDYVNGNAGNDNIDGGAGSDRLFGGQGNDSIVGGVGNDSVNGNLGNDTIDGGADNDSLHGGQGDDSITGGAGSDIVLGDLGDDTVGGGAGIDFVTGGAGADHFVFAAADAASAGVTISGTTYYDTVTDFADGEDKIDLPGAIGNASADVLHIAGASYAGTAAGLAAAQAAAQGALTTAASATAVVAVTVGTDTFLFYHDTGVGFTIDSAVKLTGVDSALITSTDFI